jgi:DNA-directed RNA polymerase subunit RPC12/RpoP
MVVMEYKCQICGARFEVNCIDREDPRERNDVGGQVTCPACHAPRVEPIRAIRRVPR